MEKIISKVEKQELEITYIKKTLDKLVEQNEKQNEQLAKISESIAKQEIILEKISNLEEKYQEGIKRIHKRIDGELALCEKTKDDCDKECEKLSKRMDELEEKLATRPCVSHNVIEAEIKHLKEYIEKHNKIFWWIGTVILGVIIVSIVESVMK
jgi:predicted nuclease with TOPRIM domain